eukprot:GGOE01040456.1.p1 GENE.GGOE01040456.1~~GGOE01040456.1.p1  ORF type:complete len:433 (+),score=32.26 GGOE01040456.1:40-1299(+)
MATVLSKMHIGLLASVLVVAAFAFSPNLASLPMALNVKRTHPRAAFGSRDQLSSSPTALRFPLSQGRTWASSPHATQLSLLSSGTAQQSTTPPIPCGRGAIAALLLLGALFFLALGFASKHSLRRMQPWVADQSLPDLATPAVVGSAPLSHWARPQLPFDFDASWSGEAKHAAHCWYILSCTQRGGRRGHSPVCPQCWANLPACVCDCIRSRCLPPGVELVVWMHHKEWGTPSNTGVLLARSLHGSRLLMKGLPEHDLELRTLLADPNRCCVTLWPGGSPDDHLSTAREVQAAAQGKATITLILLDGTWPGARRMRGRLPSTTKRWALSAEDLLWHTTGPGPEQQSIKISPSGPIQSLIAPLRKRNGMIHTEVCTAQAGVAALRALGLGYSACQDLLALTQLKVARVANLRSRGHTVGA